MTGGSTLSGIVVLSNCRSIENNTRNLLFDGNIFASDSHDSPLLALIHMYNNSPSTIYHPDQIYFAYMTLHVRFCDRNIMSLLTNTNKIL